MLPVLRVRERLLRGMLPLHFLILSLSAHCFLDRFAHKQDYRDLRTVEACCEYIGHELAPLVKEEKVEIVDCLHEVFDSDDQGYGIEEELKI